MNNHEQAVRDAALAFQKAHDAAVAAGYRVVWPGSAKDLDKIAISETSKLPPREPLTRPPVSTFARPLPDAKPVAQAPAAAVEVRPIAPAAPVPNKPV